jgi:hypothetical protein
VKKRDIYSVYTLYDMFSEGLLGETKLLKKSIAKKQQPANSSQHTLRLKSQAELGKEVVNRSAAVSEVDIL